MAIALILVAAGFIWIMIAPHYNMSFQINNYTTTTSQVTPITANGTLSASLDMPYALILIVIGFAFAFVAILVEDKKIRVETSQ